MTKEDYIKSLAQDNIPADKWQGLIAQWELDNPETEEVEEVTETVQEGNLNDLPPTGADVGQEIVAPEETEVTESQSEDGSSEYSDQVFDALNQRIDAFAIDKNLSKDEYDKRQKQREKYVEIAKPEEVITKNKFDYKYDQNGVYYYKPTDSKDDWKTYEDKKSEGNLAIASEFGHFDYDKYLKQQDFKKDFDFNLELNPDSVKKVEENLLLKSNQIELEKQINKEFRKELMSSGASDLLNNESLYKKFKTEYIKKQGIVLPQINETFDEKLDAFIFENNLATSNKYSEFANDSISLEVSKGNFQNLSDDQILNPAYNLGALKETLGEENKNEFLGFLKSKGLANDYAQNLTQGSYGDDINRASLGEKNYNKLQIEEESILDNYLSLFLNEANEKNNDKIYVNYIKNNPEKFKNLDSIVEAKEIAKQNLKQKYGTSNFPIVDPNKIKSYKERIFPKLTQSNKNNQALTDKKILEIQEEGSSEGLLADSASKFLKGYYGQAEDIALSMWQILGADVSIARNLDNRQAAEEGSQDVRYMYVEGVTADVDGVSYLKNKDGMIYDTTNKTILGSKTEEELKKISEALEESKEKGSDFSAAGGAEMMAATTGTMAFDLSTIYGGGRLLKFIPKIAKLTSVVKMPVATKNAFAYYSMSGYVSTRKDTYNQAIKAGISMDEADELSKTAGLLGGTWYGITSLFAPTSTYMKNFNKALGQNNLISKAINGYKKKGTGGFSKVIIDKMKGLKPTKVGITKTLGAGSQEFLQENTQEGGMVLGLNPFINNLSSSNFLDEEYSRADFVNTSLLSFGAGSAFANINISGSKPNAQQQLQNLYAIGQDLSTFETLGNQMVANEEITQQELSDLLFNVKAVYNQSSKIPSTVSSETQLESAKLLQKIQDLEIKKKRVDENFHGPIDKIIDKNKKKLAEIVKPELEKSKSRKGAKAMAEQLGNEFETYQDQESIDARVKELKDQGGKPQSSAGYGQAIDMSDVEGYDGPKKIIIINDQVAAEDNVYTTDQHEILHPFWSQTLKGNPDVAVSFGTSLLSELQNNPDVVINDPEVQRRVDQYIKAGIATPEVMEEVMNFTSEALSKGKIVLTPKKLTFLGKLITKVFGEAKQPLNIRFDKGSDVLDFLVNYNKTIESGKGFTESQLKIANEGAKGELVDNAAEISKQGLIDQNLDKKEEKEIEEIVSKESKRQTQVEASNRVQKIYEKSGADGAFDIIEEFKPITNRIVESRSQAPGFDRQLLTDEIETGKRGILDLIREYDSSKNKSVAAYINTFLPARAIEASKRVLGEEFTTDVTEAKNITATELDLEIKTKPLRKEIKPSSFLSSDANNKIKKEIASKIKDIDPKDLTFKKLGNLAPEIIAEEIGIPVKKLTDPKSNLSKADATAIQQFVNKNADRLLKLLPEGAVLEAASDKLIGTSTGVPKGLLDAFYTKQARNKKGAGLATQKLNNNIDKASFLEAFGIVDGKKQEGFSARSPQAQALKGIASLFGRLVTNEIVRSDIDLDLKTKQDVAAGKSRAMASARINEFIEDQSFVKNADELAAENKRWKYLAKTIDVKYLDSKNKNDVAEMQIWVRDVLAPLLPKEFFTNGTFANAGKSAANRNFFFESGITKKDGSLGELGILLEKVVFGDSNSNVSQASTRQTYVTGGKNGKVSTKFKKEFNTKAFKNKQQAKLDGLKDVFKVFETLMKKDPKNASFIIALLGSTSQGMAHFVRTSAPVKFYALNIETGIVEEHTMPASLVAKRLFNSAFAGEIDKDFKGITKNYFQGAIAEIDDKKLKGTKPNGDPFNYTAMTPEGWKITDNIWARYFNLNVANTRGGINPSNIMLADNMTVFDKFGITPSGLKIISSQKASYNRVPKLNSKISTNVDPNASPQEQVYELEQLDDRAKVERSKSSKKNTFDKIFNDILESSTGIESYKDYSSARAKTVGANKGKFSFFNTPSAEDFNGLLYKTLGKGKVGDAQMAFYKTNLLDPYNRAELSVTKAKISAANDFKGLKRNLKTLPKSMSKPTGIGGFTFGQAARVAVWTKQGMNIPGLSKRDVKELNDFVDNNKEMNTFANELINIQKGKPYPKPGDSWLGGNITSDILNEINKVNRKEYLTEWQENVDIIFSEKNMNKLEAAYGPNYVEALKDQLSRMKSGSNRPIGGSRVVNNVLDWLNNSVGAVMFLNTRSAVLQTISAVNFINFGNNNIYKAGKAFANQPQFWKDFKTLMNSPYLTERRQGLKINVSESEIADAVAESSNKPKAAISYLLNKGFIMTRIADSFAIASGGSAFYRNQLDAYVKDGMDPKQAEKKAFDDFYAIAEESQQSSNPSKISQQQASGAGRVILAFANTPMQYARIIKRSSQDLINGRGDWKSNVSKIVFYGAVQNLVFNALQNALFSEAFGEEEDDEQKEDKTGRIANGMADSLLRGLGIQGAVVSALKNSLITIADENNKKSPKFVKAVYDLFDFSPPLDSKFRKLRSGANTITWEKENIKDKGFDLNNPAYLAGAQLVSGLTNLPLDRAIQKLNNIRAIMSNSSQNWQKVAMAMGWSTWDIGLPYYGVDDKIEQTPEMILKEKVITMAKETSTKEQKQMLLDLGLTKQEICLLYTSPSPRD